MCVNHSSDSSYSSSSAPRPLPGSAAGTSSAFALDTSDFWVGPVLGEGAFARVLHCQLKRIHNKNDTQNSRKLTRNIKSDGYHDDIGGSVSGGDDVAVKVVEKIVLQKHPAYMQAILQEQRILRQLTSGGSDTNSEASLQEDQAQNPHVIKLLASFHDQECVYLVMELAELTVQDAICSFFSSRKERRHSTNESSSDFKDDHKHDIDSPDDASSVWNTWWLSVATSWGYQLLEALEYLHYEHHIIHCDIKPSNLLLVRSGDDHNSSSRLPDICRRYRLRLCDFGSAIVMNTPTNPQSQQQINQQQQQQQAANSTVAIPRGTADYASPELLRSDGRSLSSLSYAVDLWSLGCVLYALLRKESPFHAESDALAVDKILHYCRSCGGGSTTTTGISSTDTTSTTTVDNHEEYGNDDNEHDLIFSDATHASFSASSEPAFPENWKKMIRTLLRVDPVKRSLVVTEDLKSNNVDDHDKNKGYTQLKRHPIWKGAGEINEEEYNTKANMNFDTTSLPPPWFLNHPQRLQPDAISMQDGRQGWVPFLT